MSTVLDLFNPSGASQETQKNTDLYKVSYKDSKSGVYKSVIRFLPNPKDTSKCIMSKFVTWVKNPTTQKGMYIDDPKTIREYSPVSDMYWKLKNSGIASYAAFADEYLGGKQQYASLIQIMEDEQHPELVGQIKVFIYGKKIYEKLHNEEYPAAGTGLNPFHPYLGRKFSIVCVNQSNFNNFDQSVFFDERNGNQILPSGMWYIDPANPNQYSVCNENTDGQVLLDYLLNNAPDLSKYDFTPWTDIQRQHVEDVISIATNYLTTGSMSPVQPAAYSQPAMGMPAQPGFPGGQPSGPVYNPNPVFPGATVPPTQQPQQLKASVTPPTSVPQVTVTPPVSGTSPLPYPPTSSTVGTSVVSGVTPPNVVPQGSAPAGVQPPTGMNMDDILSQL